MNENPHSWSRTALLAGLVVATFCGHLVFGIYYITHAEGVSPRPSLQTRDDEYLRSFASWGQPRENDMAAYNRAALGILDTGLPRNVSGGVSVHALVYDYFLAACYGLGGVRLISVAVPQAAVAALTALFVGLAAARLVRGWLLSAALLGGGLFIINLRMAMSVAFMMPTTLLLLWVAIALHAAARIESSRNVAKFVAAIVLAVFTQAAFFVVAAGSMGWLLHEFLRHRRPASLVGALFITGGIGVRLLLPHLNTGGAHDSWTATDQGGVLWEANNPCYESMPWFALWEARPGNPNSKWQMSPTELERYHAYLVRTGGHAGKAGFLWVRENPADYVKLCWIRLYTTLGPFTGQMSPRNRLISTGYWLLLFPAGWYGLWRLRGQPVARLAVFVFLALTVFEVLVITEWYLRYRLPWELCLTVFATVGYRDLLGRLTGGSGIRLESPAATCRPTAASARLSRPI